MDSLIYMLFVAISVPILLMACLVEKKARQPIIFFLLGIFLSVFASEINAYMRNVLPMSSIEVANVATPISEEILKALPILLYATLLAPKKEAVFTASMAVGIGFAVLENAFYLMNSDSFNMLDAIVRAFGSGLMHGLCTLLVGVGILFVKKKHKLFVVGTFAMLSTAITYHGIYNMLVQSEFKVVGFLLPISTYIPFMVWRIKKMRQKKSSRRLPIS